MTTAPTARALDPVALANELRPLTLQLNRHLRRELAPLGVTAGQAGLLHAIRTNPAVGIRGLAEREGVSPPRVTAAVDRLAEMGLVRRARSGADRRRVELEVTEAGLRVLRSARTRRTAWLAARLGRLDEDERRALAGAVRPLARLLEESE
jgi:DNA-binding MarR family transcriptional regulator